MKHHSFDQNGFYVFSGDAQKNPMKHIEGEPEFLTPANATFIEPDIAPEGKLNKFLGSKWVQVDDPDHAKKLSLINSNGTKTHELKKGKIVKRAEKDILNDDKIYLAALEKRQKDFDSAMIKIKTVCNLSDEELAAFAGPIKGV